MLSGNFENGVIGCLFDRDTRSMCWDQRCSWLISHYLSVQIPDWFDMSLGIAHSCSESIISQLPHYLSTFFTFTGQLTPTVRCLSSAYSLNRSLPTVISISCQTSPHPGDVRRRRGQELDGERAHTAKLTRDTWNTRWFWCTGMHHPSLLLCSICCPSGIWNSGF